MTDIPHPLGRVRDHRPENRLYASLLAGVSAVDLRPVKHRMYAPALDQSPYGQCVAATGVDIANAHPMHRLFSRRKTIADALRWYTWATNNDGAPGGMPGQDTGTTLDAVAKIMRAEGVIKEWRWIFTWDQFNAELQERPVAIGTDWDHSMFHPDKNGFIVPDGDSAGGHQTSIYQYLGDDIYRGRNHWKPSWGINGDYLIHGADLRSLLYQRQGDACVLIK